MDNNEYMSLTEIALYLKKSRTTVYRLLRRHNTTPYFMGARLQSPFYKRTDIEAFKTLVPKRREPVINKELHAKCRQRDGNLCVICGNDHRIVAHHVVPVGLGGKDSPDNLVTLCGFCHRAIHAAVGKHRKFFKKANRHGTLAIAKWLADSSANALAAFQAEHRPEPI